ASTAADTDARPGGYGVLGMRERAALFGGTVQVGPRPGGGFRVHLRLPVPPAPGATPGPAVVPGPAATAAVLPAPAPSRRMGPARPPGAAVPPPPPPPLPA